MEVDFRCLGRLGFSKVFGPWSFKAFWFSAMFSRVFLGQSEVLRIHGMTCGRAFRRGSAFGDLHAGGGSENLMTDPK